MRDSVQSLHSIPTNPGALSHTREGYDGESSEMYNAYTQYSSSAQYLSQIWQHQDTAYHSGTQQHLQTQQQQLYDNYIYNNNYFYSVPDSPPPPPPMNPGQEEQPPSAEYNHSSSNIPSIPNSHEYYTTGSTQSTLTQDSMEGRTHEQNNNVEQWRNNASYWDQQSHYENGYYNPQFHPSNYYYGTSTTGKMEVESGNHYGYHSNNVAQYTDFSVNNFVDKSGQIYNNNNAIPNNHSSPPNEHFFSSQDSLETQHQNNDAKGLSLNLNLGGLEIDACILNNKGSNNIKSFNAIKNKKPSPKMKKMRKKRASPHEHIPYTSQNEENHYICEFEHCGYIARRRSNMLRHIDAMHASHYIICCNQLFPTKTHFEAHRLRIHSEGIFTCLVQSCDRSFNRKSNLHKHEDHFHSESPKASISCSVCLEVLPHPERKENVVKNHAITHSTD
nr:homeobox protein 3-like [Lepeophtheirus salmonis]